MISLSLHFTAVDATRIVYGRKYENVFIRPRYNDDDDDYRKEEETFQKVRK
jgi:hypothetical protein